MVILHTSYDKSIYGNVVTYMYLRSDQDAGCLCSTGDFTLS